MNKYNVRFTSDIDDVMSHDSMVEYTSKIEEVINNISEEHTLRVTYPTTEMVRRHELRYTFYMTISTYDSLTSKALFDLLNTVITVNILNLRDRTYDPLLNDDMIGWCNEGQTTYEDGNTYYDPYYRLYINGPTDYEIVYVPYYIRNMQERDKKRYEGWTYTWKCTGSWDNQLKATTIEEAIEEFEEWYYKKLWECVDSLQTRLHEATDKYRDFADYRRFKE